MSVVLHQTARFSVLSPAPVPFPFATRDQFSPMEAGDGGDVTQEGVPPATDAVPTAVPQGSGGGGEEEKETIREEEKETVREEEKETIRDILIKILTRAGILVPARGSESGVEFMPGRPEFEGKDANKYIEACVAYSVRLEVLMRKMAIAAGVNSSESFPRKFYSDHLPKNQFKNRCALLVEMVRKDMAMGLVQIQFIFTKKAINVRVYLPFFFPFWCVVFLYYLSTLDAAAHPELTKHRLFVYCSPHKIGRRWIPSGQICRWLAPQPDVPAGWRQASSIYVSHKNTISLSTPASLTAFPPSALPPTQQGETYAIHHGAKPCRRQGCDHGLDRRRF